MTGGFFIAWLIYTIKSWYYVSGQLTVIHNQFLFYSSTSLSKLNQFKYWFYAQFVISLPFVCYAVIAAIVGICIHQYLITAIILLFALLLVGISALIYVRRVNNLVHEKRRSGLLSLSRHWRKPFFSLFIYYISDRLKLTYFITKLLSYLIIISIMFSLADVRYDIRVIGFAVLGVVMAHAVLVYQQHKFEQTYLGISRNFPYSVSHLYMQYIFTYMLLLLPEILWLFLTFSPLLAAGLLMLLIGQVLLFHSIIYKIGLAMNRYLPLVMCLFFGLFLFILFGWIWVLLPGSLLLSFALFNINYYKAELIL
jgi:hypothetical protein